MRSVILIMIVSLTFLLTGCWDQNLLVNKKFINGISFDLTEDDKLLGTVRALTIQNKGGGNFEVKDELVEAIRPDVPGIAQDLNDRLPGQIDVSKSHITLIGEDLAKKGILPILDIFYRNKDAYISSRVIIAKEKGSDLLSLEPETSPISLVILQGLQAAELISHIPKEDIFTTWTQVVDPGQDIILPYVYKGKENKIAIGGIDLFNGDKYSGVSLQMEQSVLLLLLKDQLAKVADMVTELDNKRSVGYRVSNLKRELELKLTKSDRKIICKLNLILDIDIASYSGDRRETINKDKLNKDLSEILTKQANEVTKKLLIANCDALGIGRKLASSHPDVWKKLDWEKDYKNVQFETKVKVKIDKTGSVF
jgi:Ger(x)C family germination protein